MKTKCLVIDDEPLARDLMRSHISKLDNFEIVGECSDAMKALQKLRDEKVDLMFMDVHLPQITGFEFLKILKHRPKVIVTTAHKEYALEGFELDVVDFLLKPIPFDRFLKSVNKYYELIENETEPAQIIADSSPNEEAFIYVKENKKVIRVNLSEILYVEGLSEYVQIFTEKRKIVTKSSMTDLAGKLPVDGFLRIHKSFIVATAHVEAFTSGCVDLPGKQIPIGRSYKNSVLNALQINSNQN